MRTENPIRLKCENCKTVFETDMEFECVSSNARSMGIELDFEGMVEASCPNCGKDIFVRLEVYEYPQGVVNYTENRLENGAIMIEEPVLLP